MEVLLSTIQFGIFTVAGKIQRTWELCSVVARAHGVASALTMMRESRITGKASCHTRRWKTQRTLGILFGNRRKVGDHQRWSRHVLEMKWMGMPWLLVSTAKDRPVAASPARGVFRSRDSTGEEWPWGTAPTGLPCHLSM